MRIELIKSLSTLIALEGEKLKMKQGEIKRLLNLLKLLDTLGIKDGDEVLESVDLNIKKRLKIEEVVKVLRFEPRISLTNLSKKTSIPISTLFDYLNRIKENYDLRLVFIKRRS